MRATACYVGSGNLGFAYKRVEKVEGEKGKGYNAMPSLTLFLFVQLKGETYKRKYVFFKGANCYFLNRQLFPLIFPLENYHFNRAVDTIEAFNQKKINHNQDVGEK